MKGMLTPNESSDEMSVDLSDVLQSCDIQFNLKSRHVEIKMDKEARDIASLQKAADFVKAFILGLKVEGK